MLRSLEHSGEARQTKTQIPAHWIQDVTLDKPPRLSEPFLQDPGSFHVRGVNGMVQRKPSLPSAGTAEWGEDKMPTGTAQVTLCPAAATSYSGQVTEH